MFGPSHLLYESMRMYKKLSASGASPPWTHVSVTQQGGGSPL